MLFFTWYLWLIWLGVLAFVLLGWLTVHGMADGWM